MWGLNDVFTKIISSTQALTSILLVCIFSLTLAWFQDTFSALSIFSYKTFKHNFSQAFKQSQPGWKYLLIAAIFAGPLGMVAGIIGIDFAGPVYAGTITSCYPIVTLFFSMILLGEKLSLKRFIGVLLAVTATILISVLGEKAHIKFLNLGIIFASIAAIGWGLESVLLSLAFNKTQSNMALLLGIRQCFSSCAYCIILLVLFVMGFHYWSLIESILWQPDFLIICIVTAFLSYMAYYYFIKFVGASIGTLFNATFIFWAAFFSEVMNIETTSRYFWLVACLLVVGLYLADSSIN